MDSTNAIAPIVPNDLPSTSAKKKQEEKTLLFLSIFVNQVAYKDLIAVEQDQVGNLYIKAHDLRLLRLMVSSSIQDNEFISLSDVKGVKFSYHANEQTLFIQADLNYLAKYTINLGNNNIFNDLNEKNEVNSLILNYNIYTNYLNHHYSIASSQDLTYSTSKGNFSTGFLYNNEFKGSATSQFTRLETKWQYINPSKVSQYTIGDFSSNTTDWGTSIRLAGFQWSTAYSQRPDIITTAMPSFSGSAVLPSTLDLYVNQQKIFSGQVPSGNFDIKQIPYISGNEITLITTDETGRQIVKKEPYYYSPKLLNTGIKEFSIDVGVPRYNYGSLSNNYVLNTLFSAGSFRYGYTPSLTLSGGGEMATNGLVNLGFGGTTKFLGRSIFNTALAVSNYKNNWGGLSQFSIESQLSSKISFNSSYQNTLNKYVNLGYVSQENYQKDNKLIKSTAFARSISRAGMSYLFTPQYSLAVSYNQINYADSLSKLFSMNLTGNINQNWSFYLSSYSSFNKKNNSAFLAIKYSPSIKLQTTTSTTLNNNVLSYRQEIASSNSGRIGAISGGGYVESSGSSYNGSIYGAYTGNYNTLLSSYTQNSQGEQITASATGAVIASAGKIFFANQVGNGFVIINNAGPKSQVLNGGVNLGETDAKGRFLITNLEPYQKQFIYIDPTNLPLNWSLASSEKSATIGYKRGTILDFGAHESNQGVIKLIDQSGAVIPAGYDILVNGKEKAIVGYDGQVFLENLQKENTIVVDLLDKGQCKVNFSYVKTKALFNILGNHVCN